MNSTPPKGTTAPADLDAYAPADIAARVRDVGVRKANWFIYLRKHAGSEH